jgi:tetratricopeptide (TPR) repeat protein
MGYLTNLLSKIKQTEPEKKTPPGLRDTITSLKKKDAGKRRIVFLSIFLVASLSLGLATAYFMDYLNRDPGRHTETSVPEPMLSSEESLDSSKPISDQQRTPLSVPVRLDNTGLSSESPGNRTSSDKGPKKEITIVKQLQVKEIAPETGPEPDNTQNVLYGEETDLGQVKNDVRKTDPGEEHSEDVVHDEENNKEIEEQITHFFYLARNYEQSGDLSRAVEHYKKVLQIDPQNYRTMNNIAALFIKMNLWEESLDYLQDSFKLKNNYVPTLINLGIVYAKKERTSEAESSLLKAISLEEENRAALFNIAVLYENQGAYDRAREYYQRLKILGKSEGMEGLRRLENK